MNHSYETRTRPVNRHRWQIVTAIAVAVAWTTCHLSPQAALAGDKPPSDEKPPSGEKLPSGEKVLAEYVNATGGEAAYRKIHNRVSKGYIELEAQQMKMEITISAAAPNNLHVRTVVGSFGSSEEGCDGDVVWSTNTMMGPKVKTGAERAQTLKRAVFHPELDWQKLYDKLETVGVEDVDGSECYKVVATPTTGKPDTYYYDKKTHLLKKLEATSETQMGELSVATSFSNYKDVDGLLIPHTRTIAQMGQELVYVVEEVKQNIDMPKGTFDLPDAIKELVDKSKSKKSDKKPDTQTDKK